MEVRASARKHGISDDAMLHAATQRAALRRTGIPRRSSTAGDRPRPNRAPLELVIPADEPPGFIHTPVLRPKFDT